MSIKTIMARADAATPGPWEGPCPGCAEAFERTRWNQMYCTDRCRRNHRERTRGSALRNERHARYRATDAGRSRSAAATRRRYAAAPDKALARAMVGHAVREGSLVRPDTCGGCRAEARVEAHHPRGYDRDHWLDVDWLCKRCHVVAHEGDA